MKPNPDYRIGENMDSKAVLAEVVFTESRLWVSAVVLAIGIGLPIFLQ